MTKLEDSKIGGGGGDSASEATSGRVSNGNELVLACIVISLAPLAITVAMVNSVWTKIELVESFHLAAYALGAGAVMGLSFALGGMSKCFIEIVWDTAGFRARAGWGNGITECWTWSDVRQARMFLAPETDKSVRRYLFVLESSATEICVDHTLISWRAVRSFVDALRRHTAFEESEYDNTYLRQHLMARRNLFTFSLARMPQRAGEASAAPTLWLTLFYGILAVPTVNFWIGYVIVSRCSEIPQGRIAGLSILVLATLWLVVAAYVGPWARRWRYLAIQWDEDGLRMRRLMTGESATYRWNEIERVEFSHVQTELLNRMIRPPTRDTMWACYRLLIHAGGEVYDLRHDVLPRTYVEGLLRQLEERGLLTLGPTEAQD